MGAVIVSVIVFYIRTKDRGVITGPGLVSHQDPFAPIEQIPNITQRLNQQFEGTYTPEGSAMRYPSYPGVIS